MVPKKRFGVNYTRQPAPEHSSSDEFINPYLPSKAEKKPTTKSRSDAPSTSHSSSVIKGSNDKSNHGIHFSLDLKLKYKVKVVVRHRLYTPTLNSATFQHSIANDMATLQHILQCYRNLSARSGNIREPIAELSVFFLVAFGYFG